MADNTDAKPQTTGGELEAEIERVRGFITEFNDWGLNANAKELINIEFGVLLDKFRRIWNERRVKND